MAFFYNQANLSFSGRITSSNITEGEIITRVTLTKTAVTTDYGVGDNIVYAINLINADDIDKVGITLIDNLGAFNPTGNLEVIPLDYVNDSILYYQNGVLQPAPTVEANPSLVISGITIPAGGNVTVLYEARANEYAPRGINASIINVVNAEGEGLCDVLNDSAEVPTRNEALLTIAKAVSPETLTCGGEVTYTFIIQNHGNLPVVATDDAIITDVFNPILNNITVRVNDEVIEEGVGYSYNEETGEFATIGGALPVPEATFIRDPETGIITTTPGVTILTVTGTI